MSQGQSTTSNCKQGLVLPRGFFQDILDPELSRPSQLEAI